MRQALKYTAICAFTPRKPQNTSCQTRMSFGYLACTPIRCLVKQLPAARFSAPHSVTQALHSAPVLASHPCTIPCSRTWSDCCSPTSSDLYARTWPSMRARQSCSSCRIRGPQRRGGKGVSQRRGAARIEAERIELGHHCLAGERCRHRCRSSTAWGTLNGWSWAPALLVR